MLGKDACNRCRSKGIDCFRSIDRRGRPQNPYNGDGTPQRLKSRCDACNAKGSGCKCAYTSTPAPAVVVSSGRRSKRSYGANKRRRVCSSYSEDGEGSEEVRNKSITASNNPKVMLPTEGFRLDDPIMTILQHIQQHQRILEHMMNTQKVNQ